MINKKTMNKLVKKMCAKQNGKNKLNAGQCREAIRLFLESVVELSLEENGQDMSAIFKGKK